MEESIRHTREDVPYFNSNQEDQAEYFYKYARGGGGGNQSDERLYQKKTQTQIVTDYPIRYNTYNTQYSELAAIDNGFKKDKHNRNQIMKELRQEYEILKNFRIEDNVQANTSHTRKYEKIREQLSSGPEEGSEQMSSEASKKASKVKKRESQLHYDSSRQMSALSLEKKQLEMVIGNSMRKIEELLNNELQLKKTIHELRLQIDGKGGISQEYQKIIKNLQKSEDELTSHNTKLKVENQKANLKIKELNERIQYLEKQLLGKDKQIKNAFDDQRKLHESLRLQKDKYMNMEVQCKSFKMEISLLQKAKTSEVNRLIRQLQSKENGSSQQYGQLIRKLEDQIRDKDQRYFVLLTEHEGLKRDYHLLDNKREEKKGVSTNLIQDLLFKSREHTETNNRALTDSMNLIFMKMAELEKKSDQSLKKEIEALKQQTLQNKKNGKSQNNIEEELLARITQLQKVIDRQITQKNKLAKDIMDLADHRGELEQKNSKMEKRLKELVERENRLNRQIQELEGYKNNYHQATQELSYHQSELDKSKYHIQSAKSQLENYRAQIEHWKNQYSRLLTQIQGMRAQHQSSRNQTHTYKNQAEQQKFLSRTQSENLRKEIQTYRAQAEEFKSQAESYKKQIQLFNRQFEEYQSHFDNTKNQQFSNAKVQIESAYAQAQKLKVQLLDERGQFQNYRVKVLKQVQELQQELMAQKQQCLTSKQQLAISQKQIDYYKDQSQAFTQKEKQHTSYLQASRTQIKNKEGTYENEVKTLKRKLDQALFEAEKAKKQGEFNLNQFKLQHQAEMNRVVDEYNRFKLKFAEMEKEYIQYRSSTQPKLAEKQNQITQLKDIVENVKKQQTQELQKQKLYYESITKTIQAQTTAQIKAFNDKFLAISTSNEKLLGQMANYALLEKQIMELRRTLRLSKHITTGIDHLWEVKETQYSNINEILKGVTDAQQI